jgi:hypothetical protein
MFGEEFIYIYANWFFDNQDKKNCVLERRAASQGSQNYSPGHGVLCNSASVGPCCIVLDAERHAFPACFRLQFCVDCILKQAELARHPA